MSAPISFNDPAPPAVVNYPKPERLLTGNPKRTTWNRYHNNGVSAGEWACEVGKWRIVFGNDQHEFFHIISGRCIISDEHGQSTEYGPGDGGVLTPGFKGSFEVTEGLIKRYMIVDRSSEEESGVTGFFLQVDTFSTNAIEAQLAPKSDDASQST